MQRIVTILLSDKRSGSTLLERELCKHSAVNHVVYTPHTYNETHFWLKAACLLPVSKLGFYGGVRPGNYGSPALARKSLVNFLKRNLADFETPNTDHDLIFDGWTALCEQFARPVFFEKSPQHPHHWAALELLHSWIQTTDFKVRVIGLIRNPMSVMYSALQQFSTNPQGRQFGWAQAYRNILRFGEELSDKQFRLVRYEDIVSQSQIEFENLCEFIGIQYEGTVGQSVHQDSINRWKNDVGFTLQLDKGVGELAKQLGYSPEELFNPPKPKSPLSATFYREVLLGLKRNKSKAYSFIKRLKSRIGLSD